MPRFLRVVTPLYPPVSTNSQPTPVLRCDAGRKDAENAGAKQLQCTFANQNTADKATCATNTSGATSGRVLVARQKGSLSGASPHA